MFGCSGAWGWVGGFGWVASGLLLAAPECGGYQTILIWVHGLWFEIRATGGPLSKSLTPNTHARHQPLRASGPDHHLPEKDFLHTTERKSS